MLESRTFFVVTDGEFDAGMVTVERIDVDGATIEVGHEGEVAPLRPQRGRATDQTGAPRDESASFVFALGHLGLAVAGVLVRVGPRPASSRFRAPTGLTLKSPRTGSLDGVHWSIDPRG